MESKSNYDVSVNVSTQLGKDWRYTTSMNGTDTFMYPLPTLPPPIFAPESSVNDGQTTIMILASTAVYAVKKTTKLLNITFSMRLIV